VLSRVFLSFLDDLDSLRRVDSLNCVFPILIVPRLLSNSLLLRFFDPEDLGVELLLPLLELERVEAWLGSEVFPSLPSE